MDDQFGKEVCRLIAGILISDYELDPQENEFLDRLFVQMKMPENDRLTLQPVASRSEAAATMRRLPKDTREQALSLLFEAAAADGTVHDDERRYVHAIAEELGLASAEVDQRLDQARLRR